jgi:hypothetical protein
MTTTTLFTLQRSGLRAAWLLAAALWAAGPALAQGSAWIWLDDAGRRVYSDRPPPSTMPANRVLQSGPRNTPPAADNAAAPAAEAPAGAAGATTATPTGRPAAAAPAAPAPAATESAQQAAERRRIEARNAEIKADNCRRAQASLSTLRSNARLATTNDQGRTVPMDAATRQSEVARLEQIVADNCN